MCTWNLHDPVNHRHPDTSRKPNTGEKALLCHYTPCDLSLYPGRPLTSCTGNNSRAKARVWNNKTSSIRVFFLPTALTFASSFVLQISLTRYCSVNASYAFKIEISEDASPCRKKLLQVPTIPPPTPAGSGPMEGRWPRLRLR